MTYTGSQDLRPGRTAPHSTESTTPNPAFGGTLRLYLGIFVLLILVVWSILAGLPASQVSSLPDAATGQSSTTVEPVFDGRGKWGGYAR